VVGYVSGKIIRLGKLALSHFEMTRADFKKGGGMVALKSEKIEDLTGFAMEVIRSSGKEALSYYGKGNPRVKFDEELVTEAELHLVSFFQDQLRSHFPEHQVFGYSQPSKSYSNEGKGYLWIYDAIDGVANFQAGIPMWGTSLALMENFWPILGVFYMPATGDLFHAHAGKKAFWGKKQIRVSAQQDITDESLLLTYSRFHHTYNSTFPGKIRDLGCTSAHICYVATGRAEAAVIGNETYRDLAAPRVIVEAAGGKIYRLDESEFSLDDYLDGQRIDDHLLVVAPDICSEVRSYLEETA
jgi:myo-inositol-1(or 4)-monophosphatase